MIEVDDTDFPIVVVRVPGTYTDDDVAECLAALSEILTTRHERYAVVFDAREADLPTLEQLEAAARSNRAHADTMRAKLAGMAFVVGNPALVTAVRTLLDMAPPDVPVVLEERLSGARAWARQRLAEDTA